MIAPEWVACFALKPADRLRVDVWMQGYYAHAYGKPLATNPYRELTLFTEWQDGWVLHATELRVAKTKPYYKR